MSSGHFLGLRTVIYPVTDVAKARAWYSEVLGVKPYFDEPFYVGFNVGGFELGLDPDTSSHSPGATGGVAYWGVKNADEAWARLLKQGATPATPVHDVGGGIRVATVKDPFGNVLGIIENPHFPNTAA
ncbi:VOC family protein [Hyalangium versicolor]|uniref:VOC family protein n=1 Tax=Hyalangium versicolor TaxID=2861190 RepID=UPI001CCE4839|nr:VOC family protein [Hyalangium versicolor]